MNRGDLRFLKGAFVAVSLVLGVYVITLLLLRLAALFSPGMLLTVQILLIFYCLAGTTLVREVRMVFKAVDRSLEEGRMQVARIVGRDTSALSAQEVRTAALETLAENLSDGVVAPLFWYLLLGVPGMLAYKMVNTLDSMVGYKNERYRRFGCFAARLDDVANYIPARLTAFLMVLVSGRLSLFAFVGRYGSQHASPNSGYPEAALAGILYLRPHVHIRTQRLHLLRAQAPQVPVPLAADLSAQFVYLCLVETAPVVVPAVVTSAVACLFLRICR